jgi:glycerol-3-phosphate responsive antiterminator
MDVINYSKIKKLEQEVDKHKQDYVEHLNSVMPHQIQDLDNNKSYRFGLQFKDGVTQFVYEEVL